MTEAQPGVFNSPANVPGIFATKIPSSVVLGIAILLFFLPFVDVKCNTMSLQTVSGFELATGFEIKKTDSDNSSFKF